MTYLSDKEQKRNRNKKIILFLLLFLVITISWQNIQKILYPYFESTVFAYSNTKKVVVFLPENVTSLFKSRNYYNNRIKELEENIERLENKVASHEGDLIDSQIKMDHQNEESLSTLIAHPLIMDISSVYSTIVLSKGFRDGVDEGMIVYVRGMQPVGYISKIHDKTSEMFLFSAPKNKVDGVTFDEVILPLVGIGGGNFIASIPKDISIKIGDSVYYRSNTKMKLGTVFDIKDDQQDVFVRVYVGGAYNPVKSNNFFIDK